MNTLSRRQFLCSLVDSPILLLLPDESEEGIRSKVQKSGKLSLESLLRIKSLPPLKESDFSLGYNLFEGISDSLSGKASINFNREKRVLDFGVDSFSFWNNVGLWFARLFSSKYNKMFELQNVRFLTEFDERLRWIRYGENIPREGSSSLIPHYYEFKKDGITLDGKRNIPFDGTVDNPLSLFFSLLNGNFRNNFKVVIGDKILGIKIDYTKLNELVILEASSPAPIMNSFQKAYAILYNNIPISGYLQGIEKKGEETTYLRGELSRLNVRGQEISLG